MTRHANPGDNSGFLDIAPPVPIEPVLNLPVDDSWVSAVSADWSTAADWSLGTVPGVFSNVLIGQAGAYTVTVDAFSAAYALTLDAAGATLLVGGNAGTLTVGTTISVMAGTLALADTGTNTGSLATGTLTIGAGGVLAGAGAINADLISTGSILLSAGVLVPDGGGSLGGTVEGSGTLALAGGAFTSTAAALTGAGFLEVDGGATLMIAGGGTMDGAISINGSASLAAAAGTDLTLAGAVTFGLGNGLYDGPGEIASGTVTTSGTVFINQYVDTADEPELLVNGDWINTGTVYDLGIIEGAGTIVNEAGGSLYLFDDNAGFNEEPEGATGTLTNAGTLAKTSGNGSATVDWTVLSTGLIFVVAGDLYLDGGGTLGGTIAGLGTLSLGGEFSTSLQVLNSAGAPEITSNGDLIISGSSGTLSSTAQISGTLTAASGTDVSVSGVSLGQYGLVLAGPGSITLTGAYAPAYDNSLTLASNVTLINAGTFTGAIVFTGGKTTPVIIDNLANATMDLNGVYAGNQYTNIGALFNAGTLSAIGGNTILELRLNNTGQVEISSGNTLDLRAGGTLGGTFSGAGVLDVYAGKCSSTPAALSGVATVDIGRGAALALNGSGATVGISNITSNSGHILATGGTLTFLSALQNNGTIKTGAYAISINGPVSGTGFMEVGAGGTLSLLAGAASQQQIEFLGQNAEAALTNPLDFTGSIKDFGTADTIDLVQQAETGFSFSKGVLTVVDGSATVASLIFTGNYSGSDFAISSDGHGGSTISFV